MDSKLVYCDSNYVERENNENVIMSYMCKELHTVW